LIVNNKKGKLLDQIADVGLRGAQTLALKLNYSRSIPTYVISVPYRHRQRAGQRDSQLTVA